LKGHLRGLRFCSEAAQNFNLPFLLTLPTLQTFRNLPDLLRIWFSLVLGKKMSAIEPVRAPEAPEALHESEPKHAEDPAVDVHDAAERGEDAVDLARIEQVYK
jgi:hypothetical protein